MATPMRAIQSRRLNITDELKANIRHRYEHTPESLATMAADLGCTGQTVCNLANREGWLRYVPPPRDLSPAARLLARAEKLVYPPKLAEQAKADGAQESPALSPPPDPPSQELRRVDLPPQELATGRAAPAARPGGGGEEEAPRMAGGDEDAARAAQELSPEQIADTAEPLQLTATAEQLHRELNGLLADVRAERARMRREGYGKHQLRETAQTIASLTTVLRRLQPLLCAAPQAGTDDNAYDDMPADLDAFRDALARRIEAFFESRPDEGDAVQDEAAGTDAARS